MSRYGKVFSAVIKEFKRWENADYTIIRETTHIVFDVLIDGNQVTRRTVSRTSSDGRAVANEIAETIRYLKMYGARPKKKYATGKRLPSEKLAQTLKISREPTPPPTEKPIQETSNPIYLDEVVCRTICPRIDDESGQHWRLVSDEGKLLGSFKQFYQIHKRWTDLGCPSAVSFALSSGGKVAQECQTKKSKDSSIVSLRSRSTLKGLESLEIETLTPIRASSPRKASRSRPSEPSAGTSPKRRSAAVSG